jgi:putative colanic acid biosynthesis UDP-glucose lipid carrier transferase
VTQEDMTTNSPSHSTRSGGRSLTFWIQWLVGIVAVLLLLIALTLAKTGEFATHYRVLTVLALLGSLPVYQLLRVYDRTSGFLSGSARLLAGWLILLAILAVAAFVTKGSELYSREVLLQWALMGYGLQLAAFVPLHHLARRYHERLRHERRAAIVGTGELAFKLAEKLTRHRREPLLGLIQLNDEQVKAQQLYPIIGAVSRLHDLIAWHDVRRLYIALPAAEMTQVENLYIDLLDASVDVVWIPDLARLVMLNHSVTEIEGLPAIYLNESPLTRYPTSALLKAILDRVGAALGIIVFSPLMIGTAIAVKLSSPGPVLFRQPRHGMNGKIFPVLKFRSMRMHDDKEVKQAKRNDDRITPVGRFIRRTSIDELPQLFNVLKGEMSLVGPRPHAVAHNNYYADKITAYMARHRIKPGVTGLAQISGYRGETETLDKMQKRVELDLQYINNWSLWLDIKILLKTPFTLISKEAY